MDERNQKLENSFIEMMLVVGMDNYSGLVPKDFEENVSPIGNIYSNIYQPKVLDCYFSNIVRHFYPSMWEEVFTNAKSVDLKVRRKFDAIDTTATKITEKSIVMPKPVYFTKQSKSDISHLSDEDIKNMAAFCFPDGARLSPEQPSKFQIHYFVITNLSGERSYVTCLTFHRIYTAVKGDNFWQLESYEKTDAPSEEAVTVFVPHCCAFISKQPYFTIMKQCLSILLNKIKLTSNVHLQTLVFQEFVRQLSVTPIPPAGTLAIGLHLFGHEIILHPAHHSSISILDLSLHIIFQCFSLDTIIQIITCILIEKQIIFLSDSYALLTIVTESLCSLLYPFSWCHTYVPLISDSFLELLEAPGPFIMGCHLRHLLTVKKISGLIVVNIDEGTVSVNEMSPEDEALNPGFINIIPMMPKGPVKLLAQVYKKIKFNFDLLEVESPSRFNYREEVQFRQNKISSFNKRLQYAFVELMVNLFRDIAPEVKAELNYFKQYNFLEKQLPENIPFYTKVLNTMLFQRFLDNILSKKPSFWSELELKTRTFARKSGFSLNSFVNSSTNTAVTKQGLVSTSNTEELLNEYIFFVPSINNSSSCLEYLKECIKLFTEKIKECRDFNHRTSLIYLRGLYHYASFEFKLAYEDLKNLHESADSIHVSPKLINDISSKIPAYNRPDKLVVDETNVTRPKSRTINKTNMVTLPDKDIEFHEFIELLYLLDICHCYQTRKSIFNILSQQKNCVNPFILSVFLKSWQQNHDQCFRLPQRENETNFHEWFLCVSKIIKTNHGLGHLILTSRRLLFLELGANDFQYLCRLQQIEKIKKDNTQSIFSQVGGLKIFIKDGQNISANFKKQQNIWFLILCEIWAAKMYSIEHKEDDAIILGSETILILMALHNCRSTLQSYLIDVNQVSNDMCHFYKSLKTGSSKLSSHTSNILQKKMNPNLDHGEQTIVDILYIPKDDRSQLWCALGNGIVRVFDANQWELEKEFVETNQAITCLFSPSSNQIWIGCVNIFIINTDHISCVTRLTAHKDIVTAIIPGETRSYAFSASCDGVIHKWDVTSLVLLKTIKVEMEEKLKNIKLYDGLIWCVSSKYLMAIDLDGVAIKALEPSGLLKVTKSEPMILQCFEIIKAKKEIWLGYSNTNRILILDSEKFDIKDSINLKFHGEIQKGVNALIKVKEMLWIATKVGKIHIYNLQSHQKVLVLEAHNDSIHCLHMTADRYVFSGAGSSDGKIAVWRAHL